MASITKNITIYAPLKEVYDWIEWSPNLIEVWPNLIKSVHYEQDEEGMGSHQTLYMMSGLQFRVTSRDIEKIPYKKIVALSDSGISSTITWAFNEIPDGTEIEFTAEYQVPFNAIRGLTEGIIVRLNEADLNNLLNNLKHKMEKLYRNRT